MNHPPGCCCWIGVNMVFAPSLRKRFLIVACLTAAALIVLSIATKYYLDKSGDNRLSSSRERLSASHKLQNITQLISSSQQVLNLYLVSPNIKYKKSFNQSIEQSKLLLIELGKNRWAKEFIGADRIKMLSEDISNISNISHSLIEIRADVFKMYPGLSKANQTQFVANRSVLSLLDNALLEIRDEGGVGRKTYDDFITIKDMWRRIVQLNRLYALNMTVVISKEGLKNQEKDMSIYIDTLLSYIKENLSEKFIEETEPGFQVEEAALKLPGVISGWYKDFIGLQRYVVHDEWRADIPVILKELNPAYLDVYSSLDKLQGEMNLSADTDLGLQYKSLDTVSYLIWFLIGTFVAVIFVIYYLVDASLIKPIIRLAKKIKRRNHSEWTLESEYIRSSEMAEFINAFSDMQLQISVRQNQLEYMALHDALTKLPNRNMLVERIQKAILKSEKDKEKFVLVLLDLDRFKEVNDTLGHLIGDEVLCHVAERLSKCIRDTDTVARLGGDEFAILLTGVENVSIEGLIEKFVHVLETVFKIKEHSLYIGSSLGIAMYPEHGTSTDELMKNADIAMYMAKNSNIDYAIYNFKDDVYNIKKLELLSELRHAISDDLLYLKYQPIIDVADKTIRGFEGLLRWNHPVYGEVMPDDFIPNAEQTGLIKKITEKVITNALADTVQIREILPEAYVSVNVTAWDLQDEKIISIVNDALQKNNLPPEAILLELTERSMMNDSYRVQTTLKTLSQNGINFAVDDFGTGFSSMSYLKQLPISVLKIDKSFVSGMSNNIDDKLIVHSIIGLAHNLGLSVIAEGVESSENVFILETLKCNLMQGYFYSQPLRIEKVLERISNKNISYLNLETV